MDHGESSQIIEGDFDKIQQTPENAFDDEEEEEEEWCRMCRGPAEEGRPLFKPCKCSGTIGLTHQDCLKSWLQFKRGNGRCELCDTKFQFAPKYADGAPEILPPWEVVAGLARRVAIRWLPFALRALFAASLWLLVLPLTTLYLYQGWLHRPSSISQRWKLELLISDCISGFVVTSVIIISFLCLMSFADFLRFHWQQEGQQRENQGERNQEEDEAEQQEDIGLDQIIAGDNINDGSVSNDDESMSVAVQQDEYNSSTISLKEPHVASYMDDPLFTRTDRDESNQIETQGLETNTAAAVKRQRQRDVLQRQIFDGFDFGDALNDDEFKELHPTNDRANEISQSFDNEQKVEVKMDAPIPDETENEDNILEMMRLQEEEEEQDRLQREQQVEEFRDPLIPENIQMDNNNMQDRDGNNRFEPQFEPLNPVAEPEDPMDADIHVALDELLGLRGPISALMRNLLWLLAFNTTYLGLFAFIPFSIGSTTYSVFSSSSKFACLFEFIDNNLSSTFLPNEIVNGTQVTSFDYLQHLNEESLNHNTSLKLPDVSKVILGYFTIATMVFLLQVGVSFYKALNDKESNESSPDLSTMTRRREDRMNEHHQNLRRAFPENADDDGFMGNMMDEINWEQANNDDGGMRPMDIRNAVSDKLMSVIDCAAAIVKVGVLLFLKMFLFPLLLGIWLDISTLSLFETSLEERVLYAGSDLFGAIFIHWVAGITFMLSVTVSVLQLREVVHPDLLARAIRPQEPQRDLLGNLLQEGGYTHAKRMILSLAIYALLLLAYVWLAARILLSSGFEKFVPFLRPKIYYLVMPQLQIPIELLIFHLSMLTFLENYKNQIGGMQHVWLRKMSSLMGLTAHLLPRSIEKFELIATKSLYIPTSESHDMNISESERIKVSGDIRHKKLNESFIVDPFWIQLHSLQKEGIPIDHFIESQVGGSDSSYAGEESIFETGVTKKGGYRTVSHCDSHIRFRYQMPSSSQDTKNHDTKYKSNIKLKRYRYREAEVRNKNFSNTLFTLPTTMGPYRLRKRSRRYAFASDNFYVDNIVQVEIWREVAGDPIPRPPEGWDDLGEGGAEIHGRWAWGTESKSEIENSVAQRTPFFQKETCGSEKPGSASTKSVFGLKSLFLTTKIFALLFLSWSAMLVLACAALSIPLAVGRFFFYLLRLPEVYLHDPLAFAIGGFITFPIISRIAVSLSNQKHDDNVLHMSHMAAKMRRCLSSLRVILTQYPKNWVILQTGFLWFVLSPLLLSWTYEFIIARPSSFWENTEIMMTRQSLFMSWLTGSTFLNTWAALCYIGAFRKDFLIANNPFFGVVQGADVNANNEPRNNRAVDEYRHFTSDSDASRGMITDRIKWQGKFGSIYNYFNALSSIFLHQEYDKIDRQILLNECAYPVTRELVISFLVPILAVIATTSLCQYTFGIPLGHSDVIVPLIGVLKKTFFAKILHQIYSTMTICLQLSRAFSESLESWFDAVHKEAREDRYLVGEILMNYNPPASMKNATQTGTSKI